VTSDEIGRAFLTEHLLAFEVLSVLLLAAMIGAIVLARKADFGKERDRTIPVRGRRRPDAAPAALAAVCSPVLRGQSTACCRAATRSASCSASS